MQIIDSYFEVEITKLAERIVQSEMLNRCAEAKALFDGFNPYKPRDGVKILKTYRCLCLLDIKLCWEVMAGYEINGMSYDEVLRDYARSESALKKNRMSKDKIGRINAFVLKELRSIIDLPPNVTVSFPKDKVGLVFELDGKKVSNAYELLSESEGKRLTLVALNAEIRYNHHTAVILDDPIDSYDDYLKHEACKYIAKIVSKTSLTEWYITTNDFEALTMLSSLIRCKSIVYYDNPDIALNGASTSPLFAECKPEDIQRLNQNETALLAEFICKNASSLQINPDLAFGSLTLALRNIKTEIFKKYSNLELLHPILSSNQMSDWTDRVERFIEGSILHYDPLNSPTVSKGDVASLFAELATALHGFPDSIVGDPSSYETYRLNLASTPFVQSGSAKDIINQILKKIVLAIEYKYQLEKKLVTTLQNDYHFSSLEIDSIVGTHMLGKKIEKAKKIDNNSSHGAASFIKKVSNVFNEYNVIFNALDHSLTRWVSPYISLAPKTLYKLSCAVKSL